MPFPPKSSRMTRVASEHGEALSVTLHRSPSDQCALRYVRTPQSVAFVDSLEVEADAYEGMTAARKLPGRLPLRVGCRFRPICYLLLSVHH